VSLTKLLPKYWTTLLMISVILVIISMKRREDLCKRRTKNLDSFCYPKQKKTPTLEYSVKRQSFNRSKTTTLLMKVNAFLNHLSITLNTIKRNRIISEKKQQLTIISLAVSVCVCVCVWVFYEKIFDLLYDFLIKKYGISFFIFFDSLQDQKDND